MISFIFVSALKGTRYTAYTRQMPLLEGQKETALPTDVDFHYYSRKQDKQIDEFTKNQQTFLWRYEDAHSVPRILDLFACLLSDRLTNRPTDRSTNISAHSVE